MAVLISESTDPCINLATEEYLLKSNLKEDVFFIWKSQKAFVLGRNQNPYIEVNPDFFNKGIPIIRRISGGGTIYQDEKTINFSYITSNYHKRINDYQYFLEPIIDVLQSLGIDAVFKPKSHIFVNEHKISGNAQAFINKKLLHHGTLLFDTDLNVIRDALINFKSEALGNHILSNKQEVANLIDLLDPSINIDMIIEKLIVEVINQRKINSSKIVLTKEEKDIINLLAEKKYKSWEWNFGKTSKFQAVIYYGSRGNTIIIDKGIIIKVDNDYFQDLIGIKYFSKEYFYILNKLIK